MANAQRHIVHKQSLEVHLAGKKGAKEYQDELSRTFHRAIVPLYQQLFDEVVGEHEVLRLDRVELDLGSINPRHLKEELPRLLRKHLQDALARHITQARQCNELIAEETASSPRTQAEQVQPAGRPSDSKVLPYYLKQGRLPWYTTVRDYPDMKTLCIRFARQQPDLIIRTLRETAHTRRVAGRLSFLLPEKEIIRLLGSQVGVPGHEKVLAALSVIFRNLIRKGVSQRVTTTYLWEQALYIMGRHPAIILRKFVSLWVKETFSILPAGMQAVFALSSSFSTGPFIVRLLQDAEWSTATAGLSAEVRQHSRELLQGILQKLPAGTGAPYTAEEIETRPKSGHNTRRDGQDALETGVSIGNAGLVILWPYLVHLFRGLGYMEDGAFKSPADAGRAVVVLHYISTGDTPCEEGELFLNKLLCGLDPDEPVDTGTELTEEERQEAINLLDFAGKQWTALKGITPEGLRDSFIRREGIVYLAPKGWKVLIERTAYDLLIDKLPWSVSMIRLPWNEFYITVEW
ncbi:MAG: contractile injection system tape measure protein [Cyclobacteriaceae bacterium]